MNIGYNTGPLTAFKIVSTHCGQNGNLTGITELLGRMFCWMFSTAQLISLVMGLKVQN